MPGMALEKGHNAVYLRFLVKLLGLAVLLAPTMHYPRTYGGLFLWRGLPLRLITAIGALSNLRGLVLALFLHLLLLFRLLGKWVIHVQAVRF